MKAYFDRTEPYYLSREPTFDGNEVEIDERLLNVLDSRKATLVLMEDAIEAGGAPEDTAQSLTDMFADLVSEEIQYNG
jgi:hypothetical protein